VFSCDDECLEALTRCEVELGEVDEAWSDRRWCHQFAIPDPDGSVRRGFLGKTEESRLLFVVLREYVGTRVRELISACDANQNQVMIYKQGPCSNPRKKVANSEA
jgi:hypothetical protein